tara:strand:+ start:545 stop:745 length:201 start_codon:yes stop_codon:yes gene_type:complete
MTQKKVETENAEKIIESIKEAMNARLQTLVQNDARLQKLQGQLDGILWSQGEENGIVETNNGEARQ